MGQTWKYGSGAVIPLANGTTFTVAASADDVKPSNVTYVASWGNDVTGNGSRLRPFRTLTKGFNGTSGYLIINGIFRESCSTISSRGVVGDGYAEIDGTGLSTCFSLAMVLVDITVSNFLTVMTNFSAESWLRVYIKNVGNLGGSNANAKNIKFCTFYNVRQAIFNTTVTAFQRTISNNTFVNCYDVQFLFTASPFAFIYNVFKNCNIRFPNDVGVDFSLFFQCNFRFNATAAATPTTIYPAVPTGYTYYSTIETVRTAYETAFSFSNSLPNCRVADPIFLHETIENFSLSITSPAKNMTYEGTFIGSRSRGHSVSLLADAGQSGFNNAGASNLTILDHSATLTTDGTATIETLTLDLGEEKQLGMLRLHGTIADRNGEFFNHIRDLSSSTIAAGTDVLVNNESYMVEGGSITWNSVSLGSGERFSAFTGQLSFAGSGVVRQILRTPSRPTFEMKVSSVSSAAATAATYFPYEAWSEPTVNKVGNVASGAISKGNGDVTFDRTPVNVFPVFARYIVIKVTIQNDNLPS